MREPKWVWAVWGVLGILLFLSGVVSGNVATMVVGATGAFAYASLYLTSYVKSAHIVKKALEVVFAIIALGIIVYGYIVTRSLILGVITFFVFVMFFVAFPLSYLLPRIHGRSSERD